MNHAGRNMLEPQRLLGSAEEGGQPARALRGHRALGLGAVDAAERALDQVRDLADGDGACGVLVVARARPGSRHRRQGLVEVEPVARPLAAAGPAVGAIADASGVGPASEASEALGDGVRRSAVGASVTRVGAARERQHQDAAPTPTPDPAHDSVAAQQTDRRLPASHSASWNHV